jgi:hypothetical protein
MMNAIAELKGILIVGLLLLLMGNRSLASDLIEPTRTLSNPAQSAGALSVFSEPPDLEVIMDGAHIGKTPVVVQSAALGMHVVRVKDSETQIYVEPGKSTKIAWFKGSFIKIPAEANKFRQPQIEEKKEAPRLKMSGQPVEKMEKPDPFYWPLNPGGPIDCNPSQK